MYITSKGQVTIPVDIRQKMGLLPHTEVEFIVQNGQVVLRKKEECRFKNLIGVAAGQFTTDEIMELTRE